MNLFSWLWIISWIGSCLFAQSLFKAAYASPQLSHSSPQTSLSNRYRSPSIAAVQTPLVANGLAAQSNSPNGVINSVFPLTTLPQPTTLPSALSTAAPAQVIPTPNTSSPLAELINPTAQLPFDLLQTGQTAAPDYPASGTVSHRLLQLVTHLSRWTKGISEALRLTAPLVTVVQINPPPIDVDRWNVLKISDLGILPAEAADVPRQDCIGEEAETFPPTIASLFQVQLRGKPIAEFPSQSQAERWAERLRQVIQMDNFDPQTLKPVLLDGTPGGKAGEAPLFWIEPEFAMQLNRSAELLAITWINNLRAALNVPTLSLVDAQKQMHSLIASDDRLEGTASWYGPYFHGRLTATGETFDQNELTAAHPTLPFDTYLKVTNLETGKAVIVRINDRGPYFEDRSLDLSREAARCLNSEISGVVSYEAVIMKRSSGAFDTASTDEIPAEAAIDAPVEEMVSIDAPAQTAVTPEATLQPTTASEDAESSSSSSSLELESP
jgi:rare lipoprotein A (peptidoglycan hydrolase)